MVVLRIPLEDLVESRAYDGKNIVRLSFIFLLGIYDSVYDSFLHPRRNQHALNDSARALVCGRIKLRKTMEKQEKTMGEQRNGEVRWSIL